MTSATSYNSVGAVTEFQRSGTSGGTTTTESFLYSFNSDDRIESVSLRRKVGEGSWSNVRRAVYSYYGTEDANGSEGDLKLVEIQLPSGGGWTDFEKSYYRYYIENYYPGFIHGLKYVIEPASFQMMDGLGIDPTTASDAVLSLYADYYFEYVVFTQQCTREIIYRGAQQFTFEYDPAPEPTYMWAMKTWEHRPDGSTTLVYTDRVGRPLLKEFTSGSDTWLESWSYNQWGEMMHAHPSAIIGYDEDPIFPGILRIDYHIHQGLKEHTGYTSSGGGAGYVENKWVSEGDSGTILVKHFTYTSETVGAVTIYPVATETVYRNTNSTGDITTSYSYTYYSGTVQIQEMTTTLPVVSTGQNGSGTANSSKVYFDAWNRPI